MISSSSLSGSFSSSGAAAFAFSSFQRTTNHNYNHHHDQYRHYHPSAAAVVSASMMTPRITKSRIRTIIRQRRKKRERLTTTRSYDADVANVLVLFGYYNDDDDSHQHDNNQNYIYYYDDHEDNDKEKEEEEENKEEMDRYLVTCIPGMADILITEIRTILMKQEEEECADAVSTAITATSTTTTGRAGHIGSSVDIVNNSIQRMTNSDSAITFKTYRNDYYTILNILLWTRTAHKILQHICDSYTTTTSSSSSSDTSIAPCWLLYDRDDLYEYIRKMINVRELLGNGTGGILTLSVHVNLNGNPTDIPDDLNHSHYTALTIKNALCDSVRDIRNDNCRPNVDVQNPDVPLVVSLWGTTCTTGTYSGEKAAYITVYRQIHNGGSLHRRGYRSTTTSTTEGRYNSNHHHHYDDNDNDRDDEDDNLHDNHHHHHNNDGRNRRGNAIIHKAAMKETMAAGLLLSTSWLDMCKRATTATSTSTSTTAADGDGKGDDVPPPAVMYDPMAGSGTLIIEAAMIAADIAPGLMNIKCNKSNSSMKNPPILKWKPRQRRRQLQDIDDQEAKEEEKISIDDINNIWKDIVFDATKRAKNGIQRCTDGINSSSSSSNTFANTRVQLYANDIHNGALNLFQDALQKTGLSKLVVEINHDNCDNWILPVQLAQQTTSSYATRKTTTSIAASATAPENNNCQHDQDSPPALPSILVVTNPPWGVRLTHDMEEAWESLRIFLHRLKNNSDSVKNPVVSLVEAWILSGNPHATRHLGLRKSRSIPIRTGRHDIRWIRYLINDKKNRSNGNKNNINNNNDNTSNTMKRRQLRISNIRNNYDNSNSNKKRNYYTVDDDYEDYDSPQQSTRKQRQRHHQRQPVQQGQRKQQQQQQPITTSSSSSSESTRNTMTTRTRARKATASSSTATSRGTQRTTRTNVLKEHQDSNKQEGVNGWLID